MVKFLLKDLSYDARKMNTLSRFAKSTAVLFLGLAANSVGAQTYIPVTNVLFSENFSSYPVATLPTTVDQGGKWGTATWSGPEGSAMVAGDDSNFFMQGTANQYLQMVSTRSLNLITPVFAAQDVLTYAFDFIARYQEGDGVTRYFHVVPRSASSYAHHTSIRTHNNSIRTAATDVPVDPLIDAMNTPVRIFSVINNRADAISYDRPDGLGTTNLNSHKTSLWIYHYAGDKNGTWEHLIPEYIYAPAITNLGKALDSVLFNLDSNAALRSLDLDNIEIRGSRRALPVAHVAITNKVFAEDFQRYEPGTLPTSVDAGGLWGQATWSGVDGNVAVVADDVNGFNRGETNRFLRAVTTRGLSLITPTFTAQEVLSFAFDYIPRFNGGDGTTRWFNVIPRIGAGASPWAHYTSIRTHNAEVRTAATDVPPNPVLGQLDAPVRVLTIMNNREGPITYDRPDGLGATNLAVNKCSLWIYHYTGENAGTWVHLIPEYIFSPAILNLGAAVDSVMFQLDNNTSLRSLDLDNIEILGNIHSGVPTMPIMLKAARAAGNIEIRWAGLAGKSYQVQSSSDLSGNNWVNLKSVIEPVADGEQLATDALSLESARFYRVVELGAP